MAKQLVQRVRGRAGEVVLLELEVRRLINSAGTGPGTWTYYNCGTIYEDVAPLLQAIQIHVLCEERSSANISYKIRTQISFDGQEWLTAGDVFAAQNADSYSIGAEFTDTTSFGRFIRFHIGVDDGGAMGSAVLSVTAAFKFRT